jgi:hypothetical protein
MLQILKKFSVVVMKRVALGEPNSEHVNPDDPWLKAFRPRESDSGAELRFVYSMSAILGDAPILCSGKWLSGHQAQQLGLRALSALFHSELSDSLVNMEQWLTTRTCRAAAKRGHGFGPGNP